jgi:hypothetical protein
VSLPADFSEIDVDRRAAAVLDDIDAASREWHRRNHRPRALSARDALLALQFEALVVAVAANNVRQGVALTDADHDRLLLASERISVIVDEAVA